MQTLTYGQYAKHRKKLGLPGQTRQAVSLAVKTGRITPVDGKIDPDLADEDWRKHTDPSRAPSGKEKVQNPKTAEPPVVTGPEPLTDPADYQASRANHEYWAAKNERQKYEREKKLLVPLADFVREVGLLIAASKTRMRAIGAKCGPRVAMEFEPTACQTIIDAEVDEALTELSEWKPAV